MQVAGRHETHWRIFGKRSKCFFDYLYSALPSVPLKIAQITKLFAGLLITEGYAAKRGPIMTEHCSAVLFHEGEEEERKAITSTTTTKPYFLRPQNKNGIPFFAAGRGIRRSDGSGGEMKQHDTDTAPMERTGIGIGIPTAVEESGHCKPGSLKIVTKYDPSYHTYVA